jgi:hypothetical protein
MANRNNGIAYPKGWPKSSPAKISNGSPERLFAILDAHREDEDWDITPLYHGRMKPIGFFGTLPPISNDVTVLTLTDGTITQGTTVAGNIVCTFTASDADDVLTFAFTEGTNTNGYYVISGFNVLLTTAGKTFLDTFSTMPNVSITTNTGVTVSNTITTVNLPSRYTPKLDGLTNYYRLGRTVTLTGDFYFSGYFSVDGSAYFAASKANSTGRFLYSESNAAFFVSLNNANSTVTSIDVSVFSGKGVYFIECYRVNDIVYWKVNGVQQGAGTGRGGTLYIDSFGAQWSDSTSVPYLSGYMYDVTLGTLANTEFFSLNNPFSDYPSNIYGDKGTQLTGYNFVSSQIEKKSPGVELLKENDFNSHNNWLIQGASVTLVQNTSSLSVTSSNFEGIRQPVKTEAGKTYKVRWKAKSKVNTLFIRVYDTAEFGTLIKEVTSDALQGFMTFTALSDNSNLYLRNTTAGTTEWDYITMMEMDI